jgi:hypothetical protein
MNLDDLPINGAIHCKTIVESNRILELLHKKGYKWNSGRSYKSKEGNWWLGDKTCYLPKQGVFGFAYTKGYEMFDSTFFY